MYYRKHFIGSIVNNTDRQSVIRSNGSSVNDYINQGNVVRQAVVETLVECGATAFVEDDSCIINVNGFRFDLYYSNTMSLNIYSDASIIYSSSSNSGSYQPFNNLDYNFYVIVKGNLSTSFNVYITRNNSNEENKGIGISYVTTNIKKQRRVIVRKLDSEGSESGSTGYIRNTDGSNVNTVDGFGYSTQITFKGRLGNLVDGSWNDNGEMIQLVPFIDDYGYSTFDGVYMMVASKMNKGNFYNYNNRMYYAMNYNMLVELEEP